MPFPGLFDRRLIFVTGKGGVGKTTVAAALGIAASGRGLRTVVVELAGQQRLAAAFGQVASPFEEVELAERLHAISIEPEEAMQEYFRVKGGPLAQTLGASRLFSAFAMATPGMRELLSIGKVWELAQLERRTRGAAPYDLVIVDAPASGHGVGILRTPATFAAIARVGPIAHQAGTIAATIADRSFTAVLGVCLPEELPVNETLALQTELPLDGVVLNAVLPRRFTGPELDRIATGPLDPLARAAVTAARTEHMRASAQRRQRERLRAGLRAPLIDLPQLETDQLELAQLRFLAVALDRRTRVRGDVEQPS